jgi:serine/threonine protein kinase
MEIDAATRLLQALKANGLLLAAQYEEAVDALKAPASALGILLGKGWITSYQADLLAKGRGQELILGAYVILEPIGEGGMGEVFKAHHGPMRRIVALKVIRKELLAKPEAVRRFYREARAAAQLKHPNIVLAYDAGEVGDTHVFAMEWVDGIDLSRAVKDSGPLSSLQACDYIRQAALGLQCAHQAGIVHRDIKPANLLLTRAGPPTVKILDLGLARLQEPSEGEQTLTREGSVLGTPAYIAPEQSINSRNADPRSDLYSLGCTLYFLLTGRPPFSGETATETMLLHHLHEAAALESLRPDVPADVCAVARKLMAKRPEDRFQSAGDLVQALDCIWRGDPTPSHITAIELPQLPPGRGVTTPTVLLSDHSASQPKPAPNMRGPLLAVIAGLGVLLGLGIMLGMVLVASINVHQTGKEPEKSPPEAVPPVGGAEDQRGRPPDNVARATPIRRWHAHQGGVRAVAFLSSKNFALSGGNDRLARVWDASKGKERQTLRGHKAEVTSVAFTPDGRMALAGCKDHTLRAWDPISGAERFWLKTGHSAEVTSVNSSSNGQFAVSADLAGWVRFWNLDAGKEYRGFGGPHGAVNAVLFIPPNRVFAFACGDGTVRLGNLANADEPRQLLGHNGRVFCLCISADGKLLLSAGQDGTLRLWDSSSGAEKKWFQISHHPVYVAALSPDGKYAAAWAGDAQVAAGEFPIGLWDIAMGKEVRQLHGHAGPVTGLAFSADGKQLLSGSADGTLALWPGIAP